MRCRDRTAGPRRTHFANPSVRTEIDHDHDTIHRPFAHHRGNGLRTDDSCGWLADHARRRVPGPGSHVRVRRDFGGIHDDVDIDFDNVSGRNRRWHVHPHDEGDVVSNQYRGIRARWRTMEACGAVEVVEGVATFPGEGGPAVNPFGDGSSSQDRLDRLDDRVERIEAMLEELLRAMNKDGAVSAPLRPARPAGLSVPANVDAPPVIALSAVNALPDTPRSPRSIGIAGGGGSVNVTSHAMPAGRAEALAEVLSNMPGVEVKEVKGNAIVVAADASRQHVIDRFCKTIRDANKEANRTFEISGDARDAFWELMARSDVPVFVRNRGEGINVDGDTLTLDAIGEFIDALEGRVAIRPSRLSSAPAPLRIREARGVAGLASGEIESAQSALQQAMAQYERAAVRASDSADRAMQLRGMLTGAAAKRNAHQEMLAELEHTLADREARLVDLARALEQDDLDKSDRASITRMLNKAERELAAAAANAERGQSSAMQVKMEAIELEAELAALESIQHEAQKQLAVAEDRLAEIRNRLQKLQPDRAGGSGQGSR